MKIVKFDTLEIKYAWGSSFLHYYSNKKVSLLHNHILLNENRIL